LEVAVLETTSTLMKDVINLRQVRKAKARQEAEATAALNRAAFGQTKLEKKNTKVTKDAGSRHLDAHKRDKDT
jgi:hypothetical protein